MGKDFKQWADDFLAPDSGNLDREIKSEDLLSLFNNDTRYNWSPKRMTEHLKEYCNLADHIHCLNPASVTGRASDGERWLKRDESGRQKRYYYIMSVKKAAESLKTIKAPDEPELAF